MVSEYHSNSTGFVRVGHAVAHHNSNVATMHAAVYPPMKPKHGCAGTLRLKAVRLSNWFRHALGLPEIKTSSDNKVQIMTPVPSVHSVPTEVRPHGHKHHHHGNMRHSAHGHTFMQRLTRALMMLGPWEGRAVSFILGKIQTCHSLSSCSYRISMQAVALVSSSG